jgi:formylmethanofuran dehydrogenase subunit E
MLLMKHPKGIEWKHVSLVMGTCADLAPEPLPQPVFVRKCEHCGADTYTETEYPRDVPMVCNVCASTITAPAEHDASTPLLYDLPNDVKARLIDVAL